MTAYYNEIDPEKAEWIRQLILAGIVAPGDVDERSITDVRADDLRGYTQCHFFAGIAVWSYALRLAGWPDDRQCWTGSCPCPSFSCAGKGEGFDDPRHLWPAWFRIIRECRPGVLFGEQVAAAIGHGWLDLVCGDMEAEGYAIAPAVLGAHSAGAPHIRQRLYFVAHPDSGRRPAGRSAAGTHEAAVFVRQSGEDGGELDASPHAELSDRWPEREIDSDAHRRDGFGRSSDAGLYGDSPSERCGEAGTGSGRPTERTGVTSEPSESDNSIGSELEGLIGHVRDWRGPGWLDPEQARSAAAAGATRGFWGDCDWWYGRDGKWRPIGAGLQPLATKSPARVLRLRGYGDAICAETAKAFIEAYLGSLSKKDSDPVLISHLWLRGMY